MRKYISVMFLVALVATTFGQGKNNKGKFYIYWGWNHAQYTKSDIQFKGNGYDFTLDNVAAHDRQTSFGMKYFRPGSMTIPQYNFRLGYFVSDNWNISFGIDHMKYVMDQDQVVKMNGSINTGSEFDGNYNQIDKKLTEDFLTFEHTDGLNYANLEVRRFDNIQHFPITKNGKGIDVNVTAGLGAGVLYPRSNVKLMGNERYDEFHLAGFATAAMVGINFTFWDYFFIQAEMKGGYANMNDIRTTANKSDKAKQDFFFSQQNLVFGAIIPVFTHKNKLNF
nr:hypothetical protein [Empedobacter brevis]